MNKIPIILVVAVGGLVGSCHHQPGKPGSKVDSNAIKSNSQAVTADTVIRYRSYSGVLPCTDCEGIQTTINLMGDYSYQKLSSRIRKKTRKTGETLDETGRWMLLGRDTVQLMDVTDGPNRYLKTDSSLIQLDLNGSKMAGSQAGQYELKKVK